MRSKQKAQNGKDCPRPRASEIQIEGKVDCVTVGGSRGEGRKSGPWTVAGSHRAYVNSAPSCYLDCGLAAVTEFVPSVGRERRWCHRRIVAYSQTPTLRLRFCPFLGA